MRKEPWLKEMCERIENGEEELKHRLPVWTPSCAEFRDNHRAIADALKPLPRLMMDFDEKGHTVDILKKLRVHSSECIVGAAPELGGMTILLIEESVRRGTHVLVELPEGMTADEAQRLMAEATGFEPDKAVKDVARCIYMVPEDHTRYVSEKLWTTPLQLPRGGESKAEEQKASPRGGLEGVSFKGIPYTSIISEWWSRNGGEPQDGERNVKLHKLAVNLRAICDNRKEVLMQVMPRFGLSETEMKSIVDSACKEPPKGISKMMEKILTPLLSPEGDMPDDDPQDYSSPLGDLKRGLPMGLKESLIGVPPSMQMPVLCSVLPIAAAYAD